MRYLQTYHLYEAKKHPLEDILMDAMQNTAEGQDLAAACNNRYRVDSKGKLVIEGLRGRTYIQQRADGSWEHWVLATGRVYGQGAYPTLGECLRGCWLDFLLDSTSIRPKGMNMESFRTLVKNNLGEFEGQALSVSGLRDKSVEIMHRDFQTPITNPKQLMDLPKWSTALQLLGLKEMNQAEYQLFSPDSGLVQIFFSPEELIKENYRLIRGISYHIQIQVHPWTILKAEVLPYRLDLDIGGEGEDLPAFADTIWTGKKFHKALLDFDGVTYAGMDQEVLERIKLIRQIAVNVFNDVAAGRPLGSFQEMILTFMQGRDFTFAQAKRIRDVMPEIWQAYVDTHPEAEDVKYAPILGEFF
jgi:hypothetical protein